MLRRVIFQELQTTSGDIIQLIPFVRVFYVFESPLFYNHHNRENDVISIPFAMGTHQRALFEVTHFKVLHSTTSHFPSCLFLSITNDTDIIGPFSIISSTYENFQIALYVIGLLSNLKNA